MTEGLKTFRVQGLYSLENVTLEPGRLTVLIGPNGAGKSNILAALKMLPLIQMQSMQRFVGEAGGASSLLHYGPKRTEEIELHCSFQQGSEESNYTVKLGFAAGDKLLYLDEQARHQPQEEASGRTVHLGSGHWESRLRETQGNDSNATVKTLDGWLSQVTFFHFHDTSTRSALRTNAKRSDDRQLRSDGSNLAAYLLGLKESQEPASIKSWRRMNKWVKRIAPSIKELLPTAVANGGDSVRLDWLDDQDQRFGVHQLSDGTLRSIALLTALAQPTNRLPKFMSIDEPELGLHPSAIRLIAELARSISRHTQILFATQSTAFLDHFLPEEVVVVERKGGKSVLHRLDPETLQSWLEDKSLKQRMGYSQSVPRSLHSRSSSTKSNNKQT